MNALGSLARLISRAVASPHEERVSTDYQAVNPNELSTLSRSLRDSWRDAGIPQRQRQIVDKELAHYRQGMPVAVFDALVGVLTNNITDLSGARLLEIGCSSGYYAEVFAIKNLGLGYEGCDYSEAFVALARQLYPHLPFSVQDAVDLKFADESFDIVVSGGCLLHIPEYERAIAEAARVSRRWVVFHRTPVVHLRENLVYTKKAYDVETIEIHFNEQKLFNIISRHGMRVLDANTHSIGWDSQASDALAMKTYLCERIAARP
jgi:SAM-dependent methyltransferase